MTLFLKQSFEKSANEMSGLRLDISNKFEMSKKFGKNFMIVVVSIAIVGIVLLSGCVDIYKEPEPQILNLTICSDVLNPYNDSRFLLPEEETCYSIFNESSEIYVCGNITSSIDGDLMNIEIYKIYGGQSIPLNVSTPGEFWWWDVHEEWCCINISSLSLKEGEYNLKWILGEGGNKKEKWMSFKILKIQQNQSGISEKFCNADSDCACGVHIKTAACFYGDKNFVDTSKQCPDFCTGISNNFEIKCIEGKCKQINKLSNDIRPKPAPTATNVVEANNQFAFDLYFKFKDSNDNIFFSPYSISSALAMTYEGARGKTAEEMQKVLHLPDDKEKIHSDFIDTNKELNKANKSYNLSVANALWAQNDYKFLDEYFKIVEQYYGGKATNLDFVSNTENSRVTINKWVENQTNNKIKNLIPQGVLDESTRLVLTNAIYFKANWSSQFYAENTRDEKFKLSSGKLIDSKMMHQTNSFNYGETSELQILEMNYQGNDLSMLIVLPKKDLNSIDTLISIEKLDGWKKNMTNEEVSVTVPKFKFETKYFMAKTLKEMGMPTAFSMSADFSGMNGKKDLYIGNVIHQTFIEVAENGTEAAAATAVVQKYSMGPQQEQPKIFAADHPFIFIIQQRETGNILFLGRITDPGKK